jgi:hypothetical protein
MRNQKVINCFIHGYSAESHTGNLVSKEGKLYSYNLKIAEYVGGHLVIYDYTASGQHVSQTTSCDVFVEYRVVVP